jgi:hypothetical protein
MFTSSSITGRSPRSLSSRPRATRSSTTTHALRYSHFRRFWPRLTILRHNPGLAASPPVRYKLKAERGRYSPFLFVCPLWTDNLLANRRHAAYGGSVSPGALPSAYGRTHHPIAAPPRAVAGRLRAHRRRAGEAVRGVPALLEQLATHPAGVNLAPTAQGDAPPAVGIAIRMRH